MLILTTERMIYLLSVEKNKLTPRQQEIYDYICAYIALHGYSPSINDIAKGVYVCKQVAFNHLNKLVDKGYLTYTPYTTRSIIIK